MNQLHIYPTSRALRTVSSQQKEQDGFLPTLMRMDEFEHRAILVENKMQIDSLQRICFEKQQLLKLLKISKLIFFGAVLHQE